jgi:hypothetical protein
MKLVDLLKKANQGYDDGFLSEYFSEETGELIEGQGDTLARFVVIELSETFDPDADDDAQLMEATRVMESVKDDIQNVIEALWK